MSICNLLKNTSKIPLFDPYIDIFIYDVLSIESPNKKQKKFALEAKQKFNKLYINYQQKGVIYPTEYVYGINKINFSLNKIYNNNRVYCSDILTSINTGKEINILNNFYKFYKLQLTKEFTFINKSNFYNKKKINDIVKTIQDAIILTKKIHLTIYSNNIIDDAFIDDAFIFNIKLNYNDKIIIFGDFHGSFHAFYRIFLRLHLLGIIDFQNYEIKKGYKIIFLGDIADRGQYALEIYYIICKFICNNNSDPDNLKIILNRGNHEDPVYMNRNGFYRELDQKNRNDLIKKLIIELLKYSSSGIVLTYKDKNQQYRYWLSHGGIPVITNAIYVINDDRCIQIKEKNKENTMTSYPTSIRWCDYDAGINNFKYRDGRNLISCNYLHRFLNLNKIDFVIRGHNDNTENAYLFSDSMTTKNFSFQLNNPYIYYKNNDNEHIIFPKKNDILKNPINKKIEQINGPLSTIITKNWYNENNFLVTMKNFNDMDINVYPVLTISTNSDNGRSLNKDSFVILNIIHNRFRYKK